MCQLERGEANALLGVAASEHRLFTMMKHVLVAEAARLESATEHPAANATQVVDVQADRVAAAASGAGARMTAAESCVLGGGERAKIAAISQ